MPTILIADDNSNIQKMVTLAFKGEGIDVVAVGNGEAAVKKAAEIVPDLVLADIFMPVRSGYEVCEFLKQDSRFSHVPVVLLAGAFDPFDEREAQRVGADGVLKKPFVPPDPLIALVKELLAKSSERLVGVSVQAPSAATAVPNSLSTNVPTASSAGSPIVEASIPNPVVSQPFTPPPFVQPPTAMSRVEESVEDEIDDTVVTPVRDFLIPTTENESGDDVGTIPFASMLDSVPLGTKMPTSGATEEDEPAANRGLKPAGSLSAFEGFSAWKASGSGAAISEDDEAIEQPNQFMPSTKDLVGSLWENDPSLAEKSPDETVAESRMELSPLTHSIQHVTSVRDEAESEPQVAAAPESDTAVETKSAMSSAENTESEPTPESRVTDWRSGFQKLPEPAVQQNEPSASSMSPWRQFTSTSDANRKDDSVKASEASPEKSEESNSGTETASNEVSNHEDAQVQDSQSAAVSEPEPLPYTGTPNIDYSDEAAAHSESDAGTSADSAELREDTYISGSHAEVEAEHHQEIPEVVASDATSHEAESQNTKSEDWMASLPQHLSPEDTTTIARSLVEGLAPAAVESVATSFPVPTGAPADPHMVEDIVARVVERMQPQILEIITREVLRPVVEALVRRQLEQKTQE